MQKGNDFHWPSLIIISFLVLWGGMWLFGMLGYSFADGTGDARDVAEKLVAKGRSVDDCLKIKTFFPTYPPRSQIISSCIHEYASLTKDPTACELLLPSDYGWSCLGAAREPNSRICWFDFGRNATQVGEYVMPECGGREDVKDRCCSMARSLFVEQSTSCDQFSDMDILHDQCLQELAQRERDINVCSEIVSDHVRVTCEIQVRAIIERDSSQLP